MHKLSDHDGNGQAERGESYSLKGQKVFVAGGNGMVGSAVVRRLAS